MDREERRGDYPKVRPPGTPVRSADRCASFIRGTDYRKQMPGRMRSVRGSLSVQSAARCQMGCVKAAVGADRLSPLQPDEKLVYSGTRAQTCVRKVPCRLSDRDAGGREAQCFFRCLAMHEGELHFTDETEKWRMNKRSPVDSGFFRIENTSSP